jgi:GNAT superfamily N-acetyltransferase
MFEIKLRAMREADWSAVGSLVYSGTNAWYQNHGRGPIFNCTATDAQLFCKVYESLDPGCCVVAENAATGQLAGSCFYHPRPTHVSLGIMNVHPDYFGRGIGRRLLQFVTDIADQQHKPMRLVSSAMNLDSFSLYNKAGFVPRLAYQDMIMVVPAHGFSPVLECKEKVLPATLQDVPRMAALEMELSHISRENDLRYFVSNAQKIWHVSVVEDERGGLDGFLVSVAHPASNMLGPGVARTETQAAALIAAELDHNRGRQPVWLVPSHCLWLVQTMYKWGAVNCELHFAQSRGAWTAPTGIVMPTFMPETG